MMLPSNSVHAKLNELLDTSQSFLLHTDPTRQDSSPATQPRHPLHEAILNNLSILNDALEWLNLYINPEQPFPSDTLLKLKQLSHLPFVNYNRLAKRLLKSASSTKNSSG